MEEDELPTSRKRSRSAYSDKSSSSVATISTAASRSHSPHMRHPSSYNDDYMTSQPEPETDTTRTRTGKRQRASLSGGSSDERMANDRNTRRRHLSTSPDERGRKRGRSHTRKRNRPRERSHGTRMSDLSLNGRQQSRSKSITPKPNDDMRVRQSPLRRARSVSRSRSPYQRNGGTERRHNRSPKRGSHHHHQQQHHQQSRAHGSSHKPRSFREQSLSPYSKRLALTQAMGGR
jgi:hypothetical protein